MSGQPVPRLDLAPRRKRPLALWNPLDYVVLLFWVFFFPQAILWYVENLADPKNRDSTRGNSILHVLRRGRVETQMVFQAFIATLLAIGCGLAGLNALGLPLNWPGVAVGVVGGVVGYVVFGIAFGVSLGVSLGVTVGVAAGVAAGVIAGAGDVALGIAFGVVFGVAVGAAVAVAVAIGGGAESIAGGVAFGVAGGVVFDFAVGVVFGISAGLAGGVVFDVAVGITAGVAIPTIVVLFLTRFLDWLLALALGLGPRWPPRSRVTWIPLPSTRRHLELFLESDWVAGVHNLNQILRYSLQFIPALAAANAVLSRSQPKELLPRTTALAADPFDWALLRFCSASLGNQLRQDTIDGLVWTPWNWRDRWKARYPIDVRLDTPARAACAGFWLWHAEDAETAAVAFGKIRELPHGTELHGIARAIALGQKAGELAEVARWRQEVEWLDSLPDPELRRGTLQALRTLRAVADECRAAHHSEAPLSRSTARGRASANLKRLIRDGSETCHQPEWPLIKKIAERWLDIVIQAGRAAGKEVVRQPILNPYEGYSGLPVTGPTFVGRRDVMREIETRWSTGELLPAIFLYGHRRMGKTSILRNLEPAAAPGTLLVYLDMQDAGWIDHTGQLLLDLAEAVHKRTAEAGLDPGPPPDEERYRDLGTARRALNALLARLDPQLTAGRRLILAIDEFELIEKGIAEGRIDAGLLPYLRALNQRHRWLALIFAGLHTLDEMGRDYQSAFYGQSENILVSYLGREAAMELTTRPHPDFALEYAPELREELFRLSHGQPYLLQRLCWELVVRWNERFLRQGEATPRTLVPADLEPVLDAELYAAADYYFDGVWSNVTAGERTLMTALASREGGWRREELPLPPGAPAVDEVLALLLRHDVVVEDSDGVRFASELMRRWVLRQEDGD